MKKFSGLSLVRYNTLVRKTARRRKNRRLRLAEKHRANIELQKTHAQILHEQGLVKGVSLSRRPIVLPNVFSFRENLEETIKCINEIVEFGLKRRIPLEIRFDRVKFLDPSATLVLASEIYRCRKLRLFRNGDFVTGNYPNDPNVHAHLREVGFFSLLKIADNPVCEMPEPEKDRPFFLRFTTSNRVEPAGVDSFVSIIEKYVLELNAIARGRLVGAIKEAMSNVDEHAYKRPNSVQTMKKRWYMSARVNVNTHEVMVILYDQGVGIPKTIDTDLLERLRALAEFQIDKHLHVSDGFTIKLATELWRTGTGQSGRGRGFRDMKKFIDISTDGELRVLSNRGQYTYIAGNEAFSNTAESIDGTVIEWRFRNDLPLQMTNE